MGRIFSFLFSYLAAFILKLVEETLPRSGNSGN